MSEKSLADQLRARGLAPTSAEIPPPPTEPEARPEVDLADYPVWACAWGDALVALLGERQALRALDDGTEGTGRARADFDARIERAIDQRPAREAESWRERLQPLGGIKGVPTFCAEADEVRRAIEEGAVDAYRAEQAQLAREAEGLRWPAMESGEGEHAYRERLRAWAADCPAAVLKKAGFDLHGIAREAAEADRKRREAEAARAAAQAGAVLRETLRAAPGFEAALAGLQQWAMALPPPGKRAFQPDDIARDAVAASRWPWAVVSAWKALNTAEQHGVYDLGEPPRSAIGDEDLAAIPAARLLYHAARTDDDARVEYARAGVAQRWPVSEGAVRLITASGALYLVHPDGRARRLHGGLGDFADGVYPTTPGPAGWIDIGGDGVVAGTPALYQDVVTVSGWRPGHLDIRPAVEAYGRHPERGFPRLAIRAWKTWATVAMPDGPVVRHWDAIVRLRGARLGHRIPEHAFWVDLVPGTTQAGAPRLSAGSAPRKARLVLISAAASSRGRHGWSGDTARARASGTRGGAVVLASASGGSAGGGQHRAVTLAYVPEGGTVAVDSGAGYDWTGTHIPGAGIRQG